MKSISFTGKRAPSIVYARSPLRETCLTIIKLRRSPPNTYFPQVTFLSEYTLVLVQKQGNALELCQITPGDPPGLVTHCVLVLPALQRGISCMMVECQGDQVVPSRDLLTRSHRLHFVSDPNATVLCFTLGFRQIVGGLDYLRSVSFWVRRCSLYDYATRGGCNQEYAWDAWGPSVTRWTDWEHGLAPCRPGGSRSALFPMLIDVRTGNPIVIRDFHPERVRRALARSQSPSSNKGRVKVVTESSKIEKGGEFLNDIVSWLPYCEATSEKRYGYHEVLIDDERIVGNTVCFIHDLLAFTHRLLSYDPARGRRRGDRHSSDDMIDTGFLFLSFLSGYPAMQDNFTSQQLVHCKRFGHVFFIPTPLWVRGADVEVGPNMNWYL